MFGCSNVSNTVVDAEVKDALGSVKIRSKPRGSARAMSPGLCQFSNFLFKNVATLQHQHQRPHFTP